MTFGSALQIVAVKLVDALGGDGAAFFTGQGGGDFLPRFAPLALFADEFHERFDPAVKGAATAGAFALGRLRVIDDFLIHQSRV